MLAPSILLRALAVVAAFSTIGCSYPYVYCAPDDCGPCGPQVCTDGCTDCGERGCKQPCGKPGRGLFTHLKYMASCGGGCGDIYIHPWINERPDECDPCDNHGEWIGPQSCCDGFWGSFWGQSCCGTTCYGGCGTGCTQGSCGAGCCGSGEVIHGTENVAPPEVILPGPAAPIESEPGAMSGSYEAALQAPVGEGVSAR